MKVTKETVAMGLNFIAKYKVFIYLVAEYLRVNHRIAYQMKLNSYAPGKIDNSKRLRHKSQELPL